MAVAMNVSPSRYRAILAVGPDLGEKDLRSIVFLTQSSTKLMEIIFASRHEMRGAQPTAKTGWLVTTRQTSFGEVKTGPNSMYRYIPGSRRSFHAVYGIFESWKAERQSQYR
jgi:hypothetical protein